MNTRESALEKYYENPKKCKQCGKVIEVKEGQRISDTRVKVFCSHTCSALFNNKFHTRYDASKICACGNKKEKASLTCKKCCDTIKSKIGSKTLGHFIQGHKYLTAKCQEIRKHARNTIERSNRIKECTYCQDPNFNEILQVHHLKGILEFNENSLISEINDEKNLVWLCPNHHAMLEKGLIQL